MDAILRSVFYNVGKLLRSVKIITSTSERSLLKNLGSWLGKITLGRDKPVLQRELDMKELLFQVCLLCVLFRLADESVPLTWCFVTPSPPPMNMISISHLDDFLFRDPDIATSTAVLNIVVLCVHVCRVNGVSAQQYE